MKINDALTGVLLGGLAVAVFVTARGYPPMPGQSVGAGMFPQLIAGGLMCCAVLLLVRGAGAIGSQALVTLPEWIGRNRTTLGFVMIPAALLLYVAVSETLGFIVTSTLLLAALFLVFGVRGRYVLPLALIGAVGIHYLFYTLLRVPLPWGVLSPVAW